MTEQVKKYEIATLSDGYHILERGLSGFLVEFATLPTLTAAKRLLETLNKQDEEVVEDAVISQERFGEEQLIGVMYRSVSPNGSIWTESRSPKEIMSQLHGRTDLKFEKLEVYSRLRDTGWLPWTPNAATDVSYHSPS